MTLPKHLGGHSNKTHVDEGSLKYLIEKFKPETFLDVGCGVGGMITVAAKHKLLAFGIDGDFEVERPEHLKNLIYINDYNEGFPDIATYVDLIWSVEFLEHVAEKYLLNVFNTLNFGKIIFCTANPGRNKFHFNPQPVSYWIKKFEDNGFRFLEKETEEVKVASTMYRNFVRETGMIFKNLKI